MDEQTVTIPGEKAPPEKSTAYKERLEREKARLVKCSVELWTGFAELTAEDGVKVRIPAPTLGTIQLVHDLRTDYFFDEKLGVGRLLYALFHQYDNGGAETIRLQSGGAIPDDEARKFQNQIEPYHVGYYYVAFDGAAKVGDEHSKKKVLSHYWRLKMKSGMPKELGTS